MSIQARFKLDHGSFVLDVNLELPSHGVTVLFGPSGSGKTSLLRCIAGFEPAARGRLCINDECLQDDSRFVPTHERHVGIVFQEASLFGHLNVQRNLDYGRSRTPPAQQRIAFEQAIELLGIGHLMDRSVAKLSGGERQRVAIARALLTSPSVLLMDEPLSALDQKRKKEILPFLERLHRELDIPIIYVTHAIDEVVRLADHIVLLEDGRAVASGPISDTLARLDLPPAFIEEASAVLDGLVADIDEPHALAALSTQAGTLWAPVGALRTGAATRVRIHARDVSIALSRHEDSSILNVLPATVLSFTAAAQAAHVLVECQCGATKVVARITSRSFDALNIAPGLHVWLQVKAVSLV
ncbi:molybdenum ABC transporter ATP-binding protein [Pseudoduganella sp. RAF53_2]|uniref:molybdenum ABC transporter ATP-binding protein n=1 Tax=unclassified Pseudoduganella TaxID=2637179 RepID=UPI003F97A204